MKISLREATKALVVMVIAFFITVLFSGRFYKEQVMLEADLLIEKPLDLQIFWDNEGNGFSEENSNHIQCQNTSQYEHISFPINHGNVKAIRLDFGSGENNVVLESLKINSSSLDLQNVFVAAAVNQIDDISHDAEGVTFRTVGPDPFVVIKGDVKGWKTESSYDYFYLISIFCLSFLILWPLASIICRFVDGSSIRAYEAGFLIVLFVLSLLPMTHIDRRDADETENRSLAKHPRFLVNGIINNSYGKELEAWFNDRFYGREYYIKFYNKYKQSFMGDKYENDVAFSGKDNWLFYKGDHSVELYQHRRPFTEKELASINTKLAKQNEWMKAHNIYYALMLAPNKEDIYSEFYDTNINQENVPDRIQLLLTYLKEHDSKVNVTYPLEKILEHKNDGLLYWKNDTHWNRFGSYWGYLAWMESLKPHIEELGLLSLEDMDISELKHEDDYFEVTHSRGDLGRMLKIDGSNLWDKDTCYKLTPKNGWEYKVIEKEERAGGAIAFMHTICPGKKHKVVIFRDSFTTSMEPYIASTFGEVYFIWNRDYDKYTDLILRENIDIVLNEFVSRSADGLLFDANCWEGGR